MAHTAQLPFPPPATAVVPSTQIALAPQAGDAVSGIKPVYPTMANAPVVTSGDREPWLPQPLDKSPFGNLK